MGARLIERTHIQNWAQSFESKGDFPILISKLVRASTIPSVWVDFPSGSAAFVGGWDGVVISEDERGYVPQGKSLWELGTNSDPKTKAEGDYKKRTENSLGHDPENSTLIIVTARFWEKKEEWRQGKLVEGIWKDIRVYDSSDLEQWIDLAQAVSLWFSKYSGTYPYDGMHDAQLFWEEYSIGPKGILPPKVVTSGREEQMGKLSEFLNGPPSIIGFKGSTKNEVIAFIIATAMQFDPAERDRFFAKSLIVDTEGNYRGIRINSLSSLNLIPRFDNFQPLFAAVSKGHHVLVPLGGDDSFTQVTINLPIIHKEGQIEALIEMGLSKDEAEKFSREAGRNITILKRMLEFPDKKSKWLQTQNLREIVPALLLGRWNENNLGDKEILEKLSGIPYSEYSKLLIKWRDIEESPLLQIGETWRLTSPLDLWSSISGILTENDFDLLAENFLLSFQFDQEEDNQETENNIFSFISKPNRFSSWAKEGLIQSLILIAYYGKSFEISKIKSPQLWVDDLILKLLYNADSKLWVSVDQKLPLLSEASPNSFLKAVYHSLETDNPAILKMFGTKRGFLAETGNHTGLLWALEGIAWLPEYLYDATVILLKLSSIDPGGNEANRPSNSLAEIYKPWHPQTLTEFTDRMEILKQAVTVEPEQGWNLLMRMLPKNHDHAMPTHRMRWRLFDKKINTTTYDRKEAADTYSYIVDLLISFFDNTENKFAALINASINFSPVNNEKILLFLEKVSPLITQKDYVARDVLRKILSHHRKYPDTDWSAPEEVLIRYEQLYNILEPEDLILKYKWLFNDFHIDFPDGKLKDEDNNGKYDAHFKRVKEVRIEGMKEILNKYGLHKIIELGSIVKDPSSIGETLASIINADKDMMIILEILKDDIPNLSLVHRFVLFKFLSEGLDWVFEYYKKLQVAGFKDELLAQLFIPITHSSELWNFIDNTSEKVKEVYWLNIYPKFYHNSIDEKIRGLNMLLQYNRFFSAIETCYMLKDDIPSQVIINILQKAATEKSVDNTHLKEYEISSLFETLETRQDIAKDIIAKLEWLYLPIIGSYGAGYIPKYLHNELSTNPEFFVQVLKWVYMPRDDSKKEEERKNIQDETLQNYATQGFQLLNNWKSIPGVDIEGNIDSEFLNDWIDKVRVLASAVDRLEVADSKIGYILAQYSEKNKDYWPPDEISDVIERINSDDLKLNFSIGITNKRSFTSRGPYDGGVIERANAAHFEKLAKVHKVNHPNVSKILENIVARYIEDAKREDEDAERSRLEY